MKKITLVMIAMLLVGALMISCNSEVSESASGSDSLVKVTVMSSSKGMTVTTDSSVNVETLYWFYTANKTDGSIFTTGQTGTTKTPVKTTVENEVKVPTIGLVNSDLGLFSTGSWTFSFWGYKEEDCNSTTKMPNENAKPVYYQENLAATVTGRTDLTLTLAEGEGMNAATVSFNDPTWTYTDLSQEVDLILRVYDGDPNNGGTLLDLNGDTAGQDATATTSNHTATFTGIPNQTMTAGAHTLYFEVYYKNSNNVEEHVGETVVGLNLKKGTTYTISGSIENLNETYHVFVKVVNKTTAVATQTAIASAQEVSIATPVTPQAAESSDVVATDAQKTTVIFAEGGLDHTTQASNVDDVNGKTTTTTTSSTHELEVEVKTASVASTASYVVEEGSSAVAGINLTLTKTTTTTEVVTETSSSTQLSSTTNTESKILTTFNDTYSTIKTYVAKNLSGVQVKYNGTVGEQPKFSGESFATEAALDAYTNSTDANLSKTGYVPSTGLLVFKTNHFSEFYVTSKSVACIGNVNYGSLQAAIDAAKAGDTVKVLLDISLKDQVSVEKGKELTLDLNGKNITAIDTRAIWVKEGLLSIIGEGSISSSKTENSSFNSSSSVIRVGSSVSTTSSAGLVIGKDIIVSTDCCYGVTVFGVNTYGQMLELNGQVVVTGSASAISGNGNSFNTKTTIIINSGSVVSSSKDVAIYHPQDGNLIINGGKIIGPTAIEVKGGNTIVNGGAIIATSEEPTHSTSSDGPSTSGYALVAVENRDYKGDASIVVYSGDFTGDIGVVKDSESELFDASVTIIVDSITTLNKALQYSGVIAKLANDIIDTTHPSDDTNAFVAISKSITIDGDNHKIESNAGRTIWITDSNIEVCLKNLTVNNTETLSNGYPRGVQVNTNVQNVKLIIDNCNVSAKYYAVNFCNGTSVDVVIKKSTCEGWGVLNIWSSGVYVEAEDCTFSSESISPTESFGTIVLEGDTTEQTDMHASNMMVSLKRCTITAKSTGMYQSLIQFNNSLYNGATGNAISLNNCTLESIVQSVGTANGAPIYLIIYDCGTNNNVSFDDASTFNGSNSIELCSIWNGKGICAFTLPEE